MPEFDAAKVREEFFADDSRSNYERLQAGESYFAGDDPKIWVEYRKALILTNEYEAAYLAEDQEKAREILEELLGSVGEGVEIRPPFRVDYGTNIEIGSHTFANYGLLAMDPGKITIGSYCQIGPNVQLLTPTHPVEPVTRKAGIEGSEPIVLEDNVWLGGGVIVCPGVRIGENSVIGAGAVVTKDIPPNSVAVGNPARVIKRVDESTRA